jgi:hypothetical protein
MQEVLAAGADNSKYALTTEKLQNTSAKTEEIDYGDLDPNLIPKIPKERRKKRKTKFRKENIVLMFEHSQLLELKKQLFKAGLTYHQYFGYLVQQQVAHDSRMLELMNEAQNYKKQRILEGKEQNIDAEILYSLIQEKLNDIER